MEPVKQTNKRQRAATNATEDEANEDKLARHQAGMHLCKSDPWLTCKRRPIMARVPTSIRQHARISAKTKQEQQCKNSYLVRRRWRTRHAAFACVALCTRPVQQLHRGRRARLPLCRVVAVAGLGCLRTCGGDAAFLWRVSTIPWRLGAGRRLGELRRTADHLYACMFHSSVKTGISKMRRRRSRSPNDGSRLRSGPSR